MLTVNSPLRLMNSLVPSMGSTNQKRLLTSGISPADAASSPTIGMSGVRRRRPSKITFSAHWSATVTGDSSPLISTSNSVA